MHSRTYDGCSSRGSNREAAKKKKKKKTLAKNFVMLLPFSSCFIGD